MLRNHIADAFRRGYHSKGHAMCRRIDRDREICYEIIMATWRRMFLIAQVWLTAFTMLFAGLPHVRCQCPTELVKPINPNILIPVNNCCGGSGSCCNPSRDESNRSDDPSTANEVKRPCCCCQASSAQSTDKNDFGQLKNLGCKRTLTDADPVLPSSQERVNDSVAVEWIISDIAPTCFDLSLQAGYSFQPWRTHSGPPPIDLVLTLQHFII
jgi:hypothetical protein